jgi:ribonuclease Z
VREAVTIAAVAAYHTAAEEVGSIATAARARALLLTRIVPPTADPEALLLQAGRGFSGPVIVGEDLLGFDLASGTVGWRGFAARPGRTAARRTAALSRRR